MAKGPHAQAPKGALCFPTDVPGEVYWDDEAMANYEELPPPPPDVVAEQAHKRAYELMQERARQPQPTPQPEPQHG